MVDGALNKYNNYQFESIGHSQGALLSRLLSDKALNSIELNPAYKAE
jgi:triacylglycerol esterase/lipase EstA (alpha/beta hydrolase family)